MNTFQIQNKTNYLIKNLDEIIYNYKNNENVFNLIDAFNLECVEFLKSYTNIDYDNLYKLDNIETNKLISGIENQYNNLICNIFICSKLSLSVVICCELVMNIDKFYYIIKNGLWLRNFVKKNNEKTLSFLDVFEEMKNILINRNYSIQ